MRRASGSDVQNRSPVTTGPRSHNTSSVNTSPCCSPSDDSMPHHLLPFFTTHHGGTRSNLSAAVLHLPSSFNRASSAGGVAFGLHRVIHFLPLGDHRAAFGNTWPSLWPLLQRGVGNLLHVGGCFGLTSMVVNHASPRPSSADGGPSSGWQQQTSSVRLLRHMHREPPCTPRTGSFNAAVGMGDGRACLTLLQAIDARTTCFEHAFRRRAFDRRSRSAPTNTMTTIRPSTTRRSRPPPDPPPSHVVIGHRRSGRATRGRQR